MPRQQFPVQVFNLIIIAAMARVASSVCHDQGFANSTNFELKCMEQFDFHYVTFICHSNDWTERPQVELDLSTGHTDILFENCTFPPELEVQNIVRPTKLRVIKRTEFRNLNGILKRKNLKGLSTTEFQLSSSDFEVLPFDLMYDVMNLHSFRITDTELIDIPDFFFGNWAGSLTTVNLHQNKLQRIKKNDFSRLENLINLDLAYNQITEIESAAFDKLVYLESIDLSFNRLSTLPIRIFHQTISLETLDLSRNLFNELPQDLLANTKNLKEFSMEKNNGTLSTLPDMFFGNLSNLRIVSIPSNNLKSLPPNLFTGCSKINGIDLKNNELTTLPSDLFKDARELQFLYVSNNFLEKLPPQIFSKLNRLQYLHLDSNRLTSLMSEVLEGLQSVLEFDASKNNITRINDQLFHYLKSAHMIHLSHNQITFEGHQHVAELQDKNGSSLINTSENEYVSIVRGGYVHERHLILHHNNIRELNADIIKLLKYLHYVDLSSNKISQINLSGLPIEDMVRNNTLDGKVVTNYIEINLQWNSFHCDCNIKDFIVQLNGWNGTELLSKMIYGSGYYCASPPEMRDRTLQTIPLDELNCPLNTSDPMDACTDTCICRKYQEKQVLAVDCSYKNLKSIPLSMGKDFASWSIELNMTGNKLQGSPSLINNPSLTNVISLDLSKNNISQVDIDLFSPRLRHLGLQGNSISRLDAKVLEYLTSNNSLQSITLHDNKWICDCKASPLLSFVQTKFTKYGFHEIVCNGTTRKLREMNNNELCADLTVMIVKVSLVIVFFAIVVASLLTYNYQSEIKAWLYSKQWCLWCVTEKELDENKQYDAFVSFSHKDEDFVKKEIVTKLHSEPRPYKLCLYKRDWPAGGRISTQIYRSVAQSRRTIIMLTPDFLESVWEHLELREAHVQALKDNRSRVITIIHGDIGHLDKLDSSVRDYLLFNPYIKWDDPWFWDKLRYALPHGKQSVKYKSRNIDEQYQSVQLPLTNNDAEIA